MSKSCSKCSGVGSTGGSSALDIETLLIIGGGGVAAMALTNPLTNAVYKDKEVPNWFPFLTKAAIGYACLRYGTSGSIQLMGIGAITVACVEAVKSYAPHVFGIKGKSGLLPAGGAAPATQPALPGVGSGGFNVINLNDPQWQVNSVGNSGYRGAAATMYEEMDESGVAGPDGDDSAL